MNLKKTNLFLIASLLVSSAAPLYAEQNNSWFSWPTIGAATAVIGSFAGLGFWGWKAHTKAKTLMVENTTLNKDLIISKTENTKLNEDLINSKKDHNNKFNCYKYVSLLKMKSLKHKLTEADTTLQQLNAEKQELAQEGQDLHNRNSQLQAAMDQLQRGLAEHKRRVDVVALRAPLSPASPQRGSRASSRQSSPYMLPRKTGVPAQQ